MARTLSGPGRLGSMKAMKKSLKGSAQSQVRNIPGESSLTVRILEDPPEWHGYYEHWTKDGPIPCASDECDGCESDDPDVRRRNFRYLANCYVIDDNKVRPVKFPKTLAEQLVVYCEKNGTLKDRDYELTKTGSGKNGTRYLASPDSPSKMKLSRFDDQLFDLHEVLQNMLDGADGDADEDYDEPKPKKKSSKPKKTAPDPWEDDDDRPRKKKSAVKKKSASTVRRPVKKTVAKKRTVRR